MLGLAPWLVTGAQLPLQNLWGAGVLPQQMTVGGAAAGLAVRLWSPARRRLVVWCSAGGVLAVQATVTVQAFSVLDAGLAGGAMSGVYFAGLLAGVLAAIVAGLVALLLIAAKSRALTALGVGLVAVPFGSWVGEWAGNLAALWVVPALFISVNYVLGTRLPERDPQEMALMIRQILTATLGPDGGAGPTVLLALAIGLAGAAVGELARRRRRR